MVRQSDEGSITLFDHGRIALSCFFSLCFFSAWSFRAVWTICTVGCRNSCTKETLALPSSQWNLETSSFFDILWKLLTKPCGVSEDRSCSRCACCRYSCWPLTRLSEHNKHDPSRVLCFLFLFLFLFRNRTFLMPIAESRQLCGDSPNSAWPRWNRFPFFSCPWPALK